MKRWTVLTVALALAAHGMFAGEARAANRAGAFTLTPFAGGYQFEGNQRLDDGPVYGLAIGYNFDEHWGAEAVGTYTETATVSEDMGVYGYRLDLLYHFRPDKALVPYVAAGLGGMSFDPESVDGSDEDGMANYGLGIKCFVSDNVALRADVRHIIGANIEDSEREHDTFHNLVYTAGLTFQFGVGDGGRGAMHWDADGDGISDSYDRCLDTPAGERVDSQGCPPDRDGDGVLNQLDRCPDTAAGITVDQDGCPADSDGDGVPDNLDRCPATPEGSAVDSRGCTLDRDGDGVEDRLDQCPGTPQGVAVDGGGCPYDRDRDGVYDFEDQCPGTPSGVAVGKDGCPLPVEKPSMNLDIQFATGSAAIAPEYREALKDAADFINSYPESRVVIEGHTDSVGSASANQSLSQRRAESVRAYLIENHGIAPERLKAVGLGEDRPVADNATVDGRRKNRRVLIAVTPG